MPILYDADEPLEPKPQQPRAMSTFDPNQPIDRDAVRFPEPVEDAEEIINAPIFDPNQPINRDAIRFPEPVENPEEIINAPRPITSSDDSGIDPGLVRAAEQQRQDAFQRLNEAVGYKDQYNLNADLINEGLYQQKMPSYDLVGLVQSGKIDKQDVAAVFGSEVADNIQSSVDALEQLEKYKTADGYNLVAAKLDGIPESVIVSAGFKAEDYAEADIFGDRVPSFNEFLAYYGSVYGKGDGAIVEKQKDAVYDEYIKRYGFGNFVKTTLFEAKDFTADMLIPLYWTRNAEYMSPGEIAANIGMDLLIVVPLLSAGFKAAAKSISPTYRTVQAVDNLIRAEAATVKEQTAVLTKIAGKPAADALENVYKSNKAYAESILASDKLTTQTTKLREVKAKAELEKAIRDYELVVNSTQEGRLASLRGFTNLVKDLPAVTRDNVKDLIATQGKVGKAAESGRVARVKGLEKDITNAKQRLKLAEQELAQKPGSEVMRVGNKLTDIQGEILAKEARLAAAKHGGFDGLVRELNQAKSELAKLESNSKSSAASIQKMRLKVYKLEQSVLSEFRRLQDKWGFSDPKSGGGVATRTKAPTTTSSQRVYELTKPIERMALADAKGLTMARPRPVVSQSQIAEPSRRQFVSPSDGETPVTGDKISLLDNILADEGIASDDVTLFIPDSAIESEVSAEVETKTKVSDELRTDKMTKVAPRVIRPPRKRITPDLSDQPDQLAEGFDPRGTIAWYSGMVGQDSVWYVAKYPYETEDDLTAYVGVLPPGVTPVEGGEGAALRSLQLITGKPPEQLRIDLGVQDITLRGKSISFTQDREQKTRGDITVRKGRIKVVRLDKYV